MHTPNHSYIRMQVSHLALSQKHLSVKTKYKILLISFPVHKICHEIKPLSGINGSWFLQIKKTNEAKDSIFPISCA